ncbi:MAG: transporter substrate-binding domain-containing protein [Pseudomonadota bacterium]|nr:transporter substrate-binding domain-containing protein [Pseudomonadota bacterium]
MHGSRRRLLRLALVGAVSGVQAAEPAGAVIRYGGDAAFPPFESLDDQGQPRGFQIDLLRELGGVIGAEIVVTLQPWARTETDFRAGRLDMVAMVDTVERRTWAQFAHGHATPAFAIYHRRGQADPQTLQDIADRRVAVLDRDAMRDTIKTWLSGMAGNTLPMEDAGRALAAVQHGDADVALLPRAYADPVLAAGSTPDVVASRLSLRLQSYAFAFAPTHTALAARVQRGLDELERNGRLEALRTRWLSSHRDLAEKGLLQRGLVRQREWSWGVAGVSGIALALMGAGVWRRGRRIADEKRLRQHAEVSLKRAEELLERTFTHNPEPMMIVERGSSVVRDANAALLSLLGAKAETLIGQSLRDQVHHIDAGALEQLVQSLDSEGALDAVPLRLCCADGRVRDCLVSADQLKIDEAVHVFCIVRDITEQVERDATLRQGYDALAAQLADSRVEIEQARSGQVSAEAQLNEFTRTVAHDLRTPLNAVYGFIGLLRQRLRAGHVQEALDYSGHIDRAARRMNSMIAALSDLAQVARRPLQRREVDMMRLVNDTWSLLSAAHPARRTRLQLDELPVAQADPDLAVQVWQNLLDNAMKYSALASEALVTVDSFRDGRGTWYRVTDNGAGFDMAQAQRLYLPFQRMHSNKQFEGTGVGLSLVRRIVDHHGGDIRLRSVPGVGTVAEFTLDPRPQAG